MENIFFKNQELFSAFIHEIKNSLNPVINLPGAVLRTGADRLTEEENSYLKIIERNGKKILNMVEELSFLNKLSAGDYAHGLSSVPADEVLVNAFARMSELSSNGNCRLSTEVHGELPVYTEKEIFRRIAANICLFFLSSAGDAGELFSKVTINGSVFNLTASFSKDSLNIKEQSVFDTDKIIAKGLSVTSVMPLHFAACYINYLNGEAFLSYADDGSAVFSFSVPAGPAGVRETGYGNDMVHAADPGTVREFVLLVIDDDIDNIVPVNAIIEHEFNGMGRVYHAESGGKGLDLLDRIQPDIILLDLTLPDISGLSLVRNIKHLFVKKNVPVIAFTGLDIAGDMDRMIGAGFDDVIRKPFNIETLVHKIRKWID